MSNGRLLEGEELLLSKKANCLIELSDYSLKSLPFDTNRRIGMPNGEALGGTLQLTNYRLVFFTHALNRVTGNLSIFLPTIRDTEDRSRFLVKRLHVATVNSDFDFVVWGVPPLIASIGSARERLMASPTRQSALWDAVQRRPEAVADTRTVSPVMDYIARNLPEIGEPIVGLVTDPVGVCTALNLLELWIAVRDSLR